MSSNVLQNLSSVIDEKALLARCLNNIEFAERILKLFHGRCEADLTELDQAIQSGDLESVARISHRLMGASANAAAQGLHARAADLKRAAEDCSLTEASHCVETLRDEWQRLAAALEE